MLLRDFQTCMSFISIELAYLYYTDDQIHFDE